MGILQGPTELPAQVGIAPNLRMLVSSDPLNVIMSPGYLNAEIPPASINISNQNIIFCLYSYTRNSLEPNFAILTPTIVNGVITLDKWNDGNDVLLPTVISDFANFSNTTGQIADKGFSATDPTKTKVVMLNAAPTSGNVAVFTSANGTIGGGGALGTAAFKTASNNSDTTVVSITGLTGNGNLPQFVDGSGTIGDTNTPVSTLQIKTFIKANSSGVLASPGAGPITVSVPGCNAGSIVTVTVNSSTNPVYPISILPGSGQFQVTFNADPGSSLDFFYIILTSPQ